MANTKGTKSVRKNYNSLMEWLKSVGIKTRIILTEYPKTSSEN